MMQNKTTNQDQAKLYKQVHQLEEEKKSNWMERIFYKLKVSKEEEELSLQVEDLKTRNKELHHKIQLLTTDRDLLAEEKREGEQRLNSLKHGLQSMLSDLYEMPLRISKRKSMFPQRVLARVKFTARLVWMVEGRGKESTSNAEGGIGDHENGEESEKVVRKERTSNVEGGIGDHDENVEESEEEVLQAIDAELKAILGGYQRRVKKTGGMERMTKEKMEDLERMTNKCEEMKAAMKRLENTKSNQTLESFCLGMVCGLLSFLMLYFLFSLQ